MTQWFEACRDSHYSAFFGIIHPILSISVVWNAIKATFRFLRVILLLYLSGRRINFVIYRKYRHIYRKRTPFGLTLCLCHFQVEIIVKSRVILGGYPLCNTVICLSFHCHLSLATAAGHQVSYNRDWIHVILLGDDASVSTSRTVAT